MAQARLSMQRAREIFRLRWELKRTQRENSRSVSTSVGTVNHTLLRGKAAGLDWEQVKALEDSALSQRLYGNRAKGTSDRAEPDPLWIHEEYKKAGVTLELLHMEYLEAHPNGYQYTSFCKRYTDWLAKHRLSMRQIHKAGEKLFVDYAGQKPRIVDVKTGEELEVEFFVAVLGASNYTYAEATLSQKSPDFIGSHMRCLEFLGGAPKALVPDPLKSGVTTSCRYEPMPQRTYAEMAAHDQTVVLPARPRKPKDKAKVEVAVQIAERWILARLRNERFHSLVALNQRIWELLEDLNSRPMKTYGGKSRRDLFVALDKPALTPLPATRFVHCEYKLAKVNIDYHIEQDGHYYSVPSALVRETVEARVTALTVEILHKGKRIASHPRSFHKGRHTTDSAHMPKAHRGHAEWSPSRLIAWAQKLGPHIALLVERLLIERSHPEQGYRSCLGIMRLEKRYGKDRLDQACQRALESGGRSYKHVERILKNKREAQPLSLDQEPTPRPGHDFIRGPEAYQ